MRLPSHNLARRILITGTAAFTFGALAIGLTSSLDAGASTFSGSNEVVVAADRGATAGSSSGIAAAVSSVVRTGATAATVTVTGGAAATGASAAALPDTTGSSTVLAMSGVFLTLCAAAAWALLRTSRRDQPTEHQTH